MAKGARLRLRVEGMTCAGCASKVERALAQVPGTTEVHAHPLAARVDLHYEPAPERSAADYARRIEDLGFRVVGEMEASEDAAPAVPRRMAILTASSGALLAAGWGAQELAGEWAGRALLGLAITLGGAGPVRRAAAALRQRVLDMNLLMTVAVLGALAIGDWVEGAMVMFLFCLSELLEAYSIARSRRSIETMIDLAPGTARVRAGDEVRTIRPSEIEPGMIALVRAGEKIPGDGEVAIGTATVNEAPITGESVPVAKSPGDPVYAGTLLTDGFLEIRTTRAAGQTTLARIVHLVEEAQASRAPSQKFVDRFARVYTPFVLAVAVLVATVPPLAFGEPFWGHGQWLYRALVLLVISCPCALVISTPVTIVTALGRAARNGILVKGGVFLEALGKLRAVALDKTGTVTYGHPRLTVLEPVPGWSGRDLLQLACDVEARSRHPIAHAVLERGEDDGIAPRAEGEYEATPGRGISLACGSERRVVGNFEYMRALGFDVRGLEGRARELARDGTTVLAAGLVAGSRPDLAGLIGVRDAVREHAREAVEGLRELGLEKVSMLTGDQAASAAAIAAEIGVTDFHAELLPEQKVAALRRLIADHHYVAMVGDGVNDAPALAAATVGIAMATAGTEVALETADVALMTDDLSRLPDVIELGREALAIVKQNIFISLFLKALFLGLAVCGVATLWMAILADTGASLLVTINGMRAGSAGCRHPHHNEARPARAHAHAHAH